MPKGKLWSCSRCELPFPADCFRKSRTDCVWCHFSDPAFRAMWRYRDKLKQKKMPAPVTESSFVDWYVNQPDQCHYCKTPYTDLKLLRLKRLGGNYVSWDIDRKDNSNRTYVLENLALSCFVCNTLKGSWFSESQARQIGRSVRSVFKEMLRDQVSDRADG